jgi:hypothetical protein
MKKISIAILITMFLLTGCSSNVSSKGNSESISDGEVLKFLPITAHSINLVMSGPDGSVIKAIGEIALGEKEDGSECELFLDIDQKLNGTNGSNIKFNITRSNYITWQKIYSSSVELPDKMLNKWFDYVDYRAPRPAIIFSPLFITDGLPVSDKGGSSFCALRYLDQVTKLDKSTNVLTYDIDASSQLMRKAFTNYSRNLLLAGGITNDEIENFLSVIVDKTLPDYTSALKGIELKIYKEKNTTIYEQSFMVNGVVDENFSLRVEFKPIEKINSNNLTKINDDSFFTILKSDPQHKEAMDNLRELGVEKWIAGLDTEK